MFCHFHPSLEAALSTAPLKCHPCKVLARHEAQLRERMLASRSEDDPSSEDDAVLPPEQRRNPFHHKVPLGLGPGQEWKSSKKADESDSEIRWFWPLLVYADITLIPSSFHEYPVEYPWIPKLQVWPVSCLVPSCCLTNFAQSCPGSHIGRLCQTA